MSEQYKRIHNSSFDAGNEMPASVGRGNGMTIKEMTRRIRAAEKRRGIGCQRWRLKARIIPPRVQIPRPCPTKRKYAPE